jgi:pimeloyl-ACP methyl ester carboxylesterase
MGAVLNYEVSGDRQSPAVLFLHGFMGSSADWRESMAVLGDQTFSIAADLPGHGASLELAPDSYSVDGAARAVIGILDGLEVDRPIVAGYSMGGRLALYLALRYPSRCAGLFLESASPGWRAPESGRHAALRMSRRQSAWNRETSRRFFWTGTASRSSHLWRGTRTCSVGPSRRGGATILQSWRAPCGGWGQVDNRRCGESWKVSPYRRSPSPEGWMRSTPGSHRAWRASTHD